MARTTKPTTTCPPLLRTEYAISRYNSLRIFPLRIVSETDKTFLLAKHGLDWEWYTQRAHKDRLTHFPTFEDAKAEVIRRAERALESAKAAVPKAEAKLAEAMALNAPADNDNLF